MREKTVLIDIQRKCKTVTPGLPFFMFAPSPVGEGIRPLIHSFIPLRYSQSFFIL